MMTRTTRTFNEPLLGIAAEAGHKEFALAQKFDDLHQLLYNKGGIRPTNAAIEEVAKLILLRLWCARSPEAQINGISISDLFAGEVDLGLIVNTTKLAFAEVLSVNELTMRDSSNHLKTLWPTDEPFRLENAEVLQHAVKLVNSIVAQETRIADPLGTAFDAFLSGRYDHSGGLGTYLTPSSVARSMADIALSLVDPFENWDHKSPVIADPFCGTGRFLVAAFDALETRQRSEAGLRAMLNNGLLGTDQSPSAIAKTGLNLLLYGATRPHTFAVADSITDPNLDQLSGSLKLILTNPPFGGAKYSSSEGIRRSAARIPSLRARTAIDPALAGTVRSLDLLAPGGILGIVLPDGIIDGNQFSEVLDMRLDSDTVSVAASVSLPTSTFSLSGTVAKTSAIFLRRAAATPRTVLARVDHVGFLKQAGRAVADPDGTDLPAVTKAVIELMKVDDSKEAVMTALERPLVASVVNDGLASFDPNRLDPGALESRRRIENHGAVNLGSLISYSRPKRSRLRTSEPFVSVLHVDELGTVKWHESASYEPVTPGQLASSNQILISLLNPSKLRAAVIPDDIELVHCSTEFGVFSTKHSPYAILGLLYHPAVQAQLRPLGRGTSSSRRRITPSDVLNLRVPAMIEDDLINLGTNIELAVRAIEYSRTTLNSTYRKAFPLKGSTSFTEASSIVSSS